MLKGNCVERLTKMIQENQAPYHFFLILIIYLNPAESFTINMVSDSDITCWTCPSKSSNEECNNWAPDTPCPHNETVCMTIHRLRTPTLATRSVVKSCVLPHRCTSAHVGCVDTDDGYQECTTCCSQSYCNEKVAFNVTSALQQSVLSNNGASLLQSSALLAMLFPLIMAVCELQQDS